jgi:hypothetical protein
LFEFLRASFIKKGIYVGEDINKLCIIDSFIKSGMLLNSPSSHRFDEVPRFSIQSLLAHIRARRSSLVGNHPIPLESEFPFNNSINPFFDCVEEMIERACLIQEKAHPKPIEGFVGHFLWMRSMMMLNTTPSSFLDSARLSTEASLPLRVPQPVSEIPRSSNISNYSDPGAPGVPLLEVDFQSLHSDSLFFPKEEEWTGVIVDPGRLIEEDLSFLDSSDLHPGDVFVPLNPTDLPFQLMMKIRTRDRTTKITKDSLMLINCDSTRDSQLQNTNITPLQMAELIRDLMRKSRGDEREEEFVQGKVKVSMKEVVFVIISSRDLLPSRQNTFHDDLKKQDLQGFKGKIIVTSRSDFGGLFGETLRDNAIFLFDSPGCP